jgi:peroxiredoxin
MLFLLALLPGLSAQPIDGLWHASVLNPSGDEVAFQFELKKTRAGWQGALVNGPERYGSTSGRFDGFRLTLHFDYWDATLEAALEQGRWQGAFTRTYRKTKLVRSFRAQREPFYQLSGKPSVDLSGEWLLEVNDDGKLSTYRAVWKQQGSRIEGVLLHITGDSGVLTGYVEDEYAVLSRFDGIRAILLKLRAGPGDVLHGTMDSSKRVTGRRITSGADGAAQESAEALSVTRMRDPGEAFRFSFPDLDGRMVSSSDARFQGKVLLISVMGSWCPNCHDEVLFLRELYERFRRRGLEIVALGFEYTGEAQRDMRQLRIFSRRHQVPYPVLYAGATEDVERTLSQLEGFRSYPTTILTGRDGRVRMIHTGFDGPSTGVRFEKLKREMTEAVERALSER